MGLEFGTSPVVRGPAVAAAVTAHPPLPRPVVLKFRDELLAGSRVTAGDFQAALRFAELQHVALPDALVALSYVPEQAAYEALSRAVGMPLMDLNATTVSALAVRLVPERVARRHAALAVSEDNRTLTYATSYLFDRDTEQDISFASGRQARPALARPSQLLSAIDRYYPHLSDVDRLLARLPRGAAAAHAALALRHDSPIIELCDQIVASAIGVQASDVHFEPFNDGAVVRYRINGILETVFTIPAESVSQVTNRFKVMGKTDISSRLRPQDGAFSVDVDGRAVFVRLSTMPTIHGEKIVLRVIDSEHRLVDVASLGYEPEATARLRQALARPDGLILVTGPTGSGKTTTLYAALNYLRDGRRSIVSVEDPVERRVEGVNQIQVNVLAGNTFAAVLKSVLRQDPNTLMVGEIRDSEVAQIVGQAAYTGHLVLSSMHTSDAASAMTRLTNLGLEPFKVAEMLTAVVGQRLIRRLCTACCVPEAAPVPSGQAPTPASKRMRPGAGCTQCKFSGYEDRVPVAEVFTPTDAMRRAIATGITAVELRLLMKAAGQRSMRDVGMTLVDQGVTSLAELNRVLAEDEGERRKVSGKQRVLVVDDDRMIRMLVKMLLQREGYEVLEAQDGREGVDMARLERPDLLIMDLMMPGVDGYQALAALQDDSGLAMLPVIVLTAETGPEVERAVLSRGADDYLIKPFDADVLLHRVRSVFARQLALAS